MRSIKYEATKALSQSELKSILNGIRGFKRKISEGTAVRKGNMVDTLITEPDKFEEYYTETEIPNIKNPKIKQMMDRYLDYGFQESYEEDDYFKIDNILTFVRDIFGYYTNYKDATIIDTLKKSRALVYLRFLINKEDGVAYVSHEEVTQAKAIATSLQISPYTRFYCQHIDSYDDNTEVFNQEAIYFTYNHISESNTKYDLPAKALLDRIIVDHTNKTIYPVDIKTTDGPVGSFPKKIMTFRYDIQAAWYTEAMKQWVIDKKIEDYEITPFAFVVENSGDYIGRPLVWELSKQDLKVARLGIENGVPGIKQALDLYLWHTINDEWDEDKLILENNGRIETKLHARQVLP